MARVRGFGLRPVRAAETNCRNTDGEHNCDKNKSTQTTASAMNRHGPALGQPLKHPAHLHRLPLAATARGRNLAGIGRRDGPA
jgi:hypothetical protein